MGRRLTASEETQLLREVTRDAHAATKDLRAAIAEARALTPGLVTAFEQHHAREMQVLSDHINTEANRLAALLNESIDTARDVITDALTARELVLDPDNGVIRLMFGGSHFDDHVPSPDITKLTKESPK